MIKNGKGIYVYFYLRSFCLDFLYQTRSKIAMKDKCVLCSVSESPSN